MKTFLHSHTTRIIFNVFLSETLAHFMTADDNTDTWNCSSLIFFFEWFNSLISSEFILIPSNLTLLSAPLNHLLSKFLFLKRKKIQCRRSNCSLLLSYDSYFFIIPLRFFFPFSAHRNCSSATI